MQQRIRLRYSALVNYAASLYRLAASIMFIVIIARKLSVTEFGIWSVVFSLTTFFTMPMNLWMFWANRFIARSVKGALATSFIVTLLSMLMISPIYFVVSWLISLSIGGFIYLTIYGLVLLLSTMFLRYLNSISGVLAPELNGYTTGFISTLRILVAYVLVVVLKFGLSGALLTVIVVRSLGALLNVVMLLRRKLIMWDGFSKNLAITWIKRFYIPLMRVLASQIRNLDRTIIALLTGSPIPSAYLNAAYTSRTPISEGGRAVTLSLSARLLRTPNSRDVEEIMKMFALFTGFMAVTLIMLSKPILSLLNPKYINVYVVFMISVVTEIVYGVTNILMVTSMATERRDLNLNLSLASTRLVRTPLVNFVSTFLGLMIASIIIFLVKEDYVLATMIFPITWLIASIITALIVRTHVKEAIHVNIPWRELSSIAISSTFSAITYIALSSWSIVVKSFWSDAPVLLLHILISLSVYVIVLLVLSKWFRWLITVAIKELAKEVSKIVKFTW